MKGEVVAVVLLFLKVNLCKAENVIVGSTKQLVCQIQNGNRWEKFSDVSSLWESIDNGGRYSGSNTGILTITNFQIEDSGNFRCKEDGTVVTGNIITFLPEVQASITSSVTLICTVQGTQLNWYVISDLVVKTVFNSAEYEDFTTKYLKIKSLTSNTAGIYYCKPLKANKGPHITVSILVTEWTSWNEWSVCSVSCGNGQRQRTRTCSDGQCAGSAVESEDCNVDYGINGGWSVWSTSGTCTKSCGGGLQPRVRSCNSPPQSHCGAYCIGEDNNYKPCSLSACPVDGGWSSWTSGNCNTTCGTGLQRRKRYCNNPSKANGGADCQGEEDDLISCSRSECAEQQSGNIIPIIVGTVISVLVIGILILILVMYAKRRWYNSKKEPDYEITDMTKVKGHIYGETHVNHIYHNDIQTAEKEITVTDSHIDSAHIIERYDVSDLTMRYQNREYFLQSLRAEFKLLNDSTDDPKQSNSPYEIVNTGLRQDENQRHLNSSTFDVLYTNNVSILLEPPQKDLAEQFWTIVYNQCVENIILLAKGNEKVSEFYPMLDDTLRINNFEIYLDSAERINKNIMLLTLNLQNKTTQSIRQIKMLKTNVSEYPTVQTLCFVVDKASEIRGAPVLIINGKMADLSVCGILTVCLNVVYAIKNGNTFNVLENGMVANKNNNRFFKNFDEYELCYKVLEHYLEAVHTYDFIE